MKLMRFPFFVVHLVIFAVLGHSQALSASTKIRMMAANISSGKHRVYETGEGIRIFQGLKPDVVMIQEFNYKNNTDGEIREFIDTAFGKQFHYYRENEPSDQIPNGVISRFPILASGEWEDKMLPNRDFAWARLDIPGEHDLWVVSVHLKASKKSANTRKIQAIELASYLDEANIPDGDYVAVGGDFNTQRRNELAISELENLVFEDQAPLGPDGKPGTNAHRNLGYDWILVNQNLANWQEPVDFRLTPNEAKEEGVNIFSTGLVFDSRQFKLLDRVKPVLASDSGDAKGKSQMQHMAIVKDFVVPDGDDPDDDFRQQCPRN